MLIYYSVLNASAKALRRRISDVLFTPTIIALCLLRYYRLELAANRYFKGVDSRVSTVVFSDEVERMQLLDFFHTDIAMRLNGRVHELVNGKIAILVVNLLPLVLCRPLPVSKARFLDDDKASRRPWRFARTASAASLAPLCHSSAARRQRLTRSASNARWWK